VQGEHVMFNTWKKWMHGAAAAALVAGISVASAQQTIAPAPTAPTGGPLPDLLLNYAFVNAERLKKPEDGNWLLFRRTYDGWGYSPLS
jgi:alcohol dehydrogenase (cytochrome c)